MLYSPVSEFQNGRYLFRLSFVPEDVHQQTKLRNIMRDGQASSDLGFGRSLAFVINLSFFFCNLAASNFSSSN